MVWAVSAGGVMVVAVEAAMVRAAPAATAPVATVLVASVVAVPVSAWAATDKSGKKASALFGSLQRGRVIQRVFAFW